MFDRNAVGEIMKKIWWVILLCLGAAQLTHAADVKVNWQDPDQYTDIRPTNETKDAFRKRVFEALDEVFRDNAKALPEHYLLEINVTNLDLAGDTNILQSRHGNDIRLIKDIYWPRMSLQYTLKNEQGVVISQGKADLADINFLFTHRIIASHTGFEYEERMINNWFKEQQRSNTFHLVN